MATQRCYACKKSFDPATVGQPSDSGYCSDTCEDRGVTDGKTLLVHYAHTECPIDPVITWDEENGPEYGACNSECPACGTKDIEPVSWHDVDHTCTDHCAAAIRS